LKILHPICLKFAVIFLLFYTAAWSRQRPLSCWSWHGRNDFRLLINRTWKLLAKVFKWSPIICLLLLTVIKNPEKYECGSLRVKISECGRFYTPAWERIGKREISGISLFVRETPAQNGSVGRYVIVLNILLTFYLKSEPHRWCNDHYAHFECGRSWVRVLTLSAVDRGFECSLWVR
jgi:hypothetical protein